MAKKKSKRETESSAAADFDATLVEIESIVQRLESGDLDLSESLEQYEAAVGKLKQCHEVLGAAERKITLLSGFDAEGNPVLQSDTEAATGGESLTEKQSSRSRRRSTPGD